MGFLGYIVTSKGIKTDDTVRAIADWTTPLNVQELRSFHGLVTFYERLIWNFSSIGAPLIECLKMTSFECNQDAENICFQLFKTKLTQAPILSLPKFDKVFELDCNASSFGTGEVPG